MKIEEKLAQYEPKKMLVASLVLGLIWFIGPFDNKDQLQNQQKNLQNQIRDAEREVEDVRLAIANNEAFERQVRETASIYKEILSYFPVKFSSPEFMIMVTQQIRDAGGEPINVLPQQVERVSEIYDRHPFDVEMQGDYITIMKFLSALTRLPQITSVKSMKFTSVSADSRRSLLRFRGIVSGYSYNGNLGAEPSTGGEEGQ